ncbi:hypothetical protein TNCV_2651091 [Trichonephila clavipes]|nr:hypothetical protein TNCV_2651091 [Trichonephila clavipes]
MCVTVIMDTNHRHLPPSQYGGNDPQFVTKWARVRVPNKAWKFLREKKSDFCLKCIPVSSGKQRTPSVLCQNHHL